MDSALRFAGLLFHLGRHTKLQRHKILQSTLSYTVVAGGGGVSGARGATGDRPDAIPSRDDKVLPVYLNALRNFEVVQVVILSITNS